MRSQEMFLGAPPCRNQDAGAEHVEVRFIDRYLLKLLQGLFEEFIMLRFAIGDAKRKVGAGLAAQADFLLGTDFPDLMRRWQHRAAADTPAAAGAQMAEAAVQKADRRRGAA
ncbi:MULTISPECIES: hypothetical protein [unclassified Neorhizobium]|uniref:hypothetical protein n=1 Tax=unclassified Neorhizobium TaxID=2629175 RepID=UPI001FF48D04|nr:MULTISPECIES: hypothetical protein [unclassified Neorhizobium]MCJ9672088.1 hypothetical protein [Neorhizobium sp. SHOUNA12B]MCJ9747983.1 hypothetical protein [Neorhizobium sp. SHOUNA12A]